MNVREHNSQLVYTCSEGIARDAVWASNLARVSTFEGLTYGLSGDCDCVAHIVIEGTPRQLRVIVLES